MKPSNLSIHKTIYRNNLGYLLRRISLRDRKCKSEIIAKKLIDTATYKKAAHVMLYASLKTEVQTSFLIQYSLKMGKAVYLPALVRRNKNMEIYQIFNVQQDLRKGKFGVLEPRKIKARKGVVGCLDLVIVPGVGFDQMGGRLGRGKGYYDRFLKKAKNAKKIGLSYREQMVEKIPMTSTDVRLDQIIHD